MISYRSSSIVCSLDLPAIRSITSMPSVTGSMKPAVVDCPYSTTHRRQPQDKSIITLGEYQLYQFAASKMAPTGASTSTIVSFTLCKSALFSCLYLKTPAVGVSQINRSKRITPRLQKPFKHGISVSKYPKVTQPDYIEVLGE